MHIFALRWRGALPSDAGSKTRWEAFWRDAEDALRGWEEGEHRGTDIATELRELLGEPTEERRAIAKRHFHEGRRLHALGRTAGAEIELRKAAQMAPGFAEPHLILGLIYNRAGREPEAIRSLRRFLKLAPGDKRRTMVEKMLRQMQ